MVGNLARTLAPPRPRVALKFHLTLCCSDCRPTTFDADSLGWLRPPAPYGRAGGRQPITTWWPMSSIKCGS